MTSYQVNIDQIFTLKWYEELKIQWPYSVKSILKRSAKEKLRYIPLQLRINFNQLGVDWVGPGAPAVWPAPSRGLGVTTGPGEQPEIGPQVPGARAEAGAGSGAQVRVLTLSNSADLQPKLHATMSCLIPHMPNSYTSNIIRLSKLGPRRNFVNKIKFPSRNSCSEPR